MSAQDAIVANTYVTEHGGTDEKIAFVPHAGEFVDRIGVPTFDSKIDALKESYIRANHRTATHDDSNRM
jgi:hypothetical protein